ncbi:MAG: hypothetical protein VB141_12455 [Burkholderia gladioli]
MRLKLIRAASALALAACAAQGPQVSASDTRYNFHYAVSNSAVSSVFDDGQRTYVVVKPGAGAPVFQHANGAPWTATQAGPYYKLDGVERRFSVDAGGLHGIIEASNSQRGNAAATVAQASAADASAPVVVTPVK